jgi:light-regulated signal transduction histidine kinase (bacteriophytochrome)
MEKSICRILLVDDDEDDYIVTRDLLEEAERSIFQLEWVDNYELALKAIANQQHDAYLFDYRLGKDNGLELLREAIKIGCQQPIILLTGLGDHDIDEQAMKIGAEDYLVKDQIDTPLLERSIIHAIERKQDKAKQAKLLLELKAANQELKNFAYVVSHDLKAPLRGIVSLADWLVADYSDRLDDEGKEMLELLDQRVRRMGDLINGVLAYSRVGRLNQDRVELNLQKLVASVIEFLSLPATTSIIVETELPTIFSNKTQIEQVFQNLVSNAIKYNDKPHPQIRIGCTSVVKYWQFYIADNGCGIEERYFEKIFQIFQTISSQNTANSTGIGLAIVKKIIETYGGKIWLQSEIGQGTTFFFTLPQQELIQGEIAE